jgi:DNA-binding winged helix-turn-helix (wHTH) protein/type II secretory pathway pseudopilin PulG
MSTGVGRWLVVLVAAIIAGVLAAVLAVWHLGAYRDRLETEALRAAQSTTALFGNAARRSLIRGTTEFLETSAALLLAGSAVSVRIDIGDETVFADADDGWDPRHESSPPFDTTASGGRWVRPSGRSPYVEVIQRLDVGTGDRTWGLVRVRFAGMGISEHLRARALSLSGAGVGMLLVAVGLAWLGMCAWAKRREDGSGQSVARVGSLSIDAARKAVILHGQELSLPPKPFTLLRLLASEPGRVFSDAEIVETVWQDSAYADANDVKQCVYSLRQRLSEAESDPERLIVNVRGFGYKLLPPP